MAASLLLESQAYPSTKPVQYSLGKLKSSKGDLYFKTGSSYFFNTACFTLCLIKGIWAQNCCNTPRHPSHFFNYTHPKHSDCLSEWHRCSFSFKYYVLPSGECGTRPNDQWKIRQALRDSFSEKPWLDVFSKSDMLHSTFAEAGQNALTEVEENVSSFSHALKVSKLELGSTFTVVLSVQQKRHKSWQYYRESWSHFSRMRLPL